MKGKVRRDDLEVVKLLDRHQRFRYKPLESFELEHEPLIDRILGNLHQGTSLTHHVHCNSGH